MGLFAWIIKEYDTTFEEVKGQFHLWALFYFLPGFFHFRSPMDVPNGKNRSNLRFG